MTRKSAWLVLGVVATLLSPMPATGQTLQFAAHKDYSSGYGSASIAVGDINGDVRQDLAVANSFSDTVSVLLGNADGSFQPPRVVFLGPGNNPRSVAIADFNRDGKPDLGVANPASNTISVLPGNGDGTFQPALTLTAGTAPGSVAAGDFNGDGNPDLAAANSGSNDVSVLLGNGNGTFQAVRTFAADSGPAFVGLGDFNSDGRPDLATANNGSGTVSVLLGNGDGNFQTPRIFAAGAGVSSVAVADFNGDTRADLAAANNGANTIAVLLGNGDGSFQAAQPFATNSPTSVVAGDFNRDGKVDLAAASYRPATSSGFYVSVLPGNGNGTFQTPHTFTAGFESLGIAAGDFNRDGAPDLTVTNTFSTTVSVLLNAGNGTFPATPNYRVGRNPESIVVADFNQDGKLDQAVANAGSNNVSILPGNGDGTFQPALTFDAGRGPTSVAIGDFNRDAKLDLVVSNYGTADYYAPASFVATTVSVLLGNGDGTFQAPQPFEAGSGPNAVVVGDFNNDGLQDLAVADYGIYPQRANTVSLLLGNGNGTFRAPQTFTAGNGAVGLVIGDFNRDSKQDLAVTNYVDNTVSVLLGDGLGALQSAGVFVVGANPWTLVVSDLNGDLLPDLAVTGHSSDIVSVLIGRGDGTFAPHIWFVTDRNPTGLALGDLNGDGKADLAVTNYFATTISVLPGNGDGTFQAAQGFGAGLAPMSVAIADFNGDGKPDLAAANYFEGTVSVLLAGGGAPPPKVATPTFSPAAGTYTGSVTVTISDTTSGATIRYTTDGSTPTTSSPIYTGPISVSVTTTIRAMATASGMTNSDVATATYTIQQPQQVATPAFSPAAGTYTGSVTVTISDATSGATIRYTTDGTTPTASSPIYTGPISVSVTTTIRAMATASGMTDSAVAAATYTIQQPQQVATPAFSPAAGTYTGSVTVTISDATSGATIRYTTDGTTPTASSPIYTGPISVSVTTTIRAMATASGMTDSAVATATYTIQQPQVATPAFSPAAGTYTGSVTVTISVATSGATIRYTTDGSAPTTSSPIYTGPISVSVTTTIRAMATASGMTNSNGAAATYTIQPQQQVATPAFSPAAGTYTGSVTVTITDATAGATIRYTIDGSTPTTASPIYAGPITLTQTTTVRAMGTASGMTNSSVAGATYTIQQQVATPAFSPAAGTYTGSVTVTITDATAGAAIRYTIDGSTPTTSSPIYTGPITLTQTATVRAMGTASGMTNSNVAGATYTIQQLVATPAFSPVGGTYTGSVSVTIGTATSGATIHYTIDGTTPTTASSVYAGPIAVTQSRTIRAMAAKSGMLNSAVASATYTIQVATSTFSPVAGTYTSSVSVTINNATAGATIYYTIDGSTPTTASSVYSGPIAVTQSRTIRAMAVKTGLLNSAVASVTYTVQTATPTFNPPGGTYVVNLTVSISDATPGAAIYYTTDGSTPTTSSRRYTGPILLLPLTTTTIKAIAVVPGQTQSVVASATYRVVL